MQYNLSFKHNGKLHRYRLQLSEGVVYHVMGGYTYKLFNASSRDEASQKAIKHFKKVLNESK